MAKKIKDPEDGMKRILNELAALREELAALRPQPQAELPLETGFLFGETSRIVPIAAAFGTAPKVEIVRTLLQESPQSATQIGITTNLSTGSLYHHLRELVHSGVLASEGKMFVITPQGVRAAAALSQLVERP